MSGPVNFADEHEFDRMARSVRATERMESAPEQQPPLPNSITRQPVTVKITSGLTEAGEDPGRILWRCDKEYCVAGTEDGSFGWTRVSGTCAVGKSCNPPPQRGEKGDSIEIYCSADGTPGTPPTPAGYYFAVLTNRDYEATFPNAWVDEEEVLVQPIDDDVVLEQGRRYSGYVAEQREDGFTVVQVNPGKDFASPPPAPCGGCGWFAGATEYDCWTLTVVGAGGNMGGVDTNQTLSFVWVVDAAYPDGGYWESSDNFLVCNFQGPLRLWRNEDGEPQLTYMINPEYTLSLSCCDVASQTLYFSGGNSGAVVLCCERQLNEGPTENLFTLAITWSRCPNPNYTTPGWYCVAVSHCAGSRTCCLLTEDPGAGVVLCSGPHDEASCLALCTDGQPDPDINCPSCENDLPSVLYITFAGFLSGLGTVVATWDGFTWKSPATGSACGSITDVTASLSCNADGFSITVSGMLGGFPAIVWGSNVVHPSSCDPLFISLSQISSHGSCVGTASAFVSE